MRQLFLKACIALVAGFVIVGCGGGGGSSKAKEMAKITKTNAEEVIKNYTFALLYSQMPHVIVEAILVPCDSGSRSSVVKNGVTETTFNKCRVHSTSYDISGKLVYKKVNDNYANIKEFIDITVTEGDKKVFIKSGNLFYTNDTTNSTYTAKVEITYYYTHNGKKSEAEDIVLDISGDSSVDKYNLSGYSKFYTTKWVNIVTDSEVQNNKVCFNKGKVTLEGDKSYIELFFNNDTSVSVYVNGDFFKKYSCGEFKSNFVNTISY
jgi:hypothetical protein